MEKKLVLGQSSRREYHLDPNALLLTSFAACVSSSSATSALSLSRLQATTGSSCGSEPLAGGFCVLVGCQLPYLDFAEGHRAEFERKVVAELLGQRQT